MFAPDCLNAVQFVDVSIEAKSATNPPRLAVAERRIQQRTAHRQLTMWSYGVRDGKSAEGKERRGRVVSGKALTFGDLRPQSET
jgi:hypothetical protein